MSMTETIARIRRAMPRNADVMALCDEVERLQPKPKVPRKEYMKFYMRKRRAKGRIT